MILPLIIAFSKVIKTAIKYLIHKLLQQIIPSYKRLRLLMVPEETFVPQSVSVISSTQRTDTPARYILIRASSTEHSRRL